MRKDGVALIAEVVESKGGLYFYRVKGTNGEILFRGPKFHHKIREAREACNRHMNLIYDALNPKNGTVIKEKVIRY